MKDYDQQVLEHLSSTREDAKSLLVKIPIELLARTPEKEEWPIADHFEHIVVSWDRWMNDNMGDGQGLVSEHTHDRQSLLAALEQSENRLVYLFSKGDGSEFGRIFTIEDGGQNVYMSGRTIALHLNSHVVHHCAKIMMGLRNLGFIDFH